MANGYIVRLDSIASDGTNYYCSITVNDGVHAFPPMNPVFDISVTASVIDSYMQTIANNGPTLARDIAELVGKTYTGA